jgi:hypothetical protein
MSCSLIVADLTGSVAHSEKIRGRVFGRVHLLLLAAW